MNVKNWINTRLLTNSRSPSPPFLVMAPLGIFAVVSLGLPCLCSALRFPVEQRTSSHSSPSWVGKRDSDVGFKATLTNLQNNIYTANITVGGQELVVQIDTGSSDLWVDADKQLTLANTTTTRSNITYASGSVSGPIDFANVQLGNYKVDSQAFINVDKANDMDALFDNGISGLVGLARTNLSSIQSKLEDEYGASTKLGRALLPNLFHQNMSVPNFLSVLLGRHDDEDGVTGGTITISEYIPNYKDVAEAPQLPVVAPEVGRWLALLDKMEVNGKSFELTTGFPNEYGIPKGKAVAMFDTGFSFPPIPPDAYNFTYGSIEGAVYDAESQLWIVPCTSYSELVFTYGGQPFPIHPLDLTAVEQIPLGNGTNVTLCRSTFTPGTKDQVETLQTDFLLGDPFLRNVYALFDFGDFQDNDGSTGDPYVQLLSTTDAKTMIDDFKQSRSLQLQSLPPELPPKDLIKAVAASYDDGDSDDNSDSGAVTDTETLSAVDSESGSDGPSSSAILSRIDKYGPIFLGLMAGNLVVGVVLCAIGLTICIRRGVRQGDRRNLTASYAPLKLRGDKSTADEGGEGRYHD